MPSSGLDPSPSLPMYMPGRRRMCSRQSSDLISSSVYLTSCISGLDGLPAFSGGNLEAVGLVLFPGLDDLIFAPKVTEFCGEDVISGKNKTNVLSIKQNVFIVVKFLNFQSMVSSHSSSAAVGC